MDHYDLPVQYSQYHSNQYQNQVHHTTSSYRDPNDHLRVYLNSNRSKNTYSVTKSGEDVYGKQRLTQKELCHLRIWFGAVIVCLFSVLILMSIWMMFLMTRLSPYSNDFQVLPSQRLIMSNPWDENWCGDSVPNSLNQEINKCSLKCSVHAIFDEEHTLRQAFGNIAVAEVEKAELKDLELKTRIFDLIKIYERKVVITVEDFKPTNIVKALIPIPEALVAELNSDLAVNEGLGLDVIAKFPHKSKFASFESPYIIYDILDITPIDEEFPQVEGRPLFCSISVNLSPESFESTDIGFLKTIHELHLYFAYSLEVSRILPRDTKCRSNSLLCPVNTFEVCEQATVAFTGQQAVDNINLGIIYENTDTSQSAVHSGGSGVVLAQYQDENTKLHGVVIEYDSNVRIEYFGLASTTSDELTGTFLEGRQTIGRLPAINPFLFISGTARKPTFAGLKSRVNMESCVDSKGNREVSIAITNLDTIKNTYYHVELKKDAQSINLTEICILDTHPVTNPCSEAFFLRQTESNGDDSFSDLLPYRLEQNFAVSNFIPNSADDTFPVIISVGGTLPTPFASSPLVTRVRIEFKGIKPLGESSSAVIREFISETRLTVTLV